MVRNEDIKFVGNYNDISCGQCVYKMALTKFFPEQDWSFDKIDEICGATPGKYTWPFKPVVELVGMGLDVIFYTTFDTARFIESPEDYLEERGGPEGRDDNIRNSDMPAVIQQAKNYLKALQAKKLTEKNQYYTAQTMRDLLDQGYILSVWVNARRLNNADGVAGHSILVIDYDDQGLFAHDPGGNFKDGSPDKQFPRRYIKNEDFIAAASQIHYGNTDDLIAMRKS